MYSRFFPVPILALTAGLLIAPTSQGEPTSNSRVLMEVIPDANGIKDTDFELGITAHGFYQSMDFKQAVSDLPFKSRHSGSLTLFTGTDQGSLSFVVPTLERVQKFAVFKEKNPCYTKENLRVGLALTFIFCERDNYWFDPGHNTYCDIRVEADEPVFISDLQSTSKKAPMTRTLVDQDTGASMKIKIWWEGPNL